ncbi:MAG: TatD family hydrolase [Roseivirga sp.]
MELIDTHAHLYAQEFGSDLAQVMARSLEYHVHQVYMPNIDLATIDAMLALEDQYPNQCAAMIGIHPCHIGEDFEKQLAQVEAWLGKRPWAAMGEIGMDLYRDKTYQAQQEQALAMQLTWAQQHRLPVAIHCRHAFKETIRLIEQHQDGHLRGVFHCFSGTAQEAAQIIELGFYLGIGGLLTFKNAGVDRVVADIALDHLVLETDAPYLAPTPYRGQRNEPAYLLQIAEKLADIHEVSVETVAAVTTTNANHLYNVSI